MHETKFVGPFPVFYTLVYAWNYDKKLLDTLEHLDDIFFIEPQKVNEPKLKPIMALQIKQLIPQIKRPKSPPIFWNSEPVERHKWTLQTQGSLEETSVHTCQNTEGLFKVSLVISLKGRKQLFLYICF